jgi:hypothetical protein
MKQKPKFNKLINYISIGLTKYRNFMNNEISEDAYINSRLDANEKKTISWPELILLRSRMDLYAKYLLKFSMYGRRFVLLKMEVIGFSKNQLYNLYGISNDTLRSYFIKRKEKKVKKKHQPKIRDITMYAVPKEIVAYLAILARVPFSWLEEEVPELEWSVYHFKYLKDFEMSLIDFKRLLEEEYPMKKIPHDVRGIVINKGIKYPIYLRFEWLDGGFIIEIFNPKFTFCELMPIIELLQPFNCQFGYMDTVIPSQNNFTFISKYKSKKPICLPMEYKAITLHFLK